MSATLAYDKTTKQLTYTKPAGEVGTHHQLTVEPRHDGSMAATLYGPGMAVEAALLAPALARLFFDSPGGDTLYVKAFDSIATAEVWDVNLGVNGSFSTYFATGVAVGGNLAINIIRDGGSIASLSVFGAVAAKGVLAVTDELDVTDPQVNYYGQVATGGLFFQGDLQGTLSYTYSDASRSANAVSAGAYVRSFDTSTGKFVGRVNGNVQGGDALGLNVYGAHLAVDGRISYGPGASVVNTPNVTASPY